jgi:hypothetical protein
MAVIPHPPYSPDMAPCDFFLFPKMKLMLKGRQFYNSEEIQAESQRVLDTVTEKDFQEAFQQGGDGGTGVYMREGTTSRVMVVDRPYGEFYDVYSVSPECFGYPSYNHTPQIHHLMTSVLVASFKVLKSNYPHHKREGP